MRLLALVLAVTVAGCGGSQAGGDIPPWALGCIGGAAGPVGYGAGRCAYREANESACRVDIVALMIYAAAGCAGAAVAVHVGRGDASTASPRPAPVGGP